MNIWHDLVLTAKNSAVLPVMFGIYVSAPLSVVEIIAAYITLIVKILKLCSQIEAGDDRGINHLLG